MVAQAVGSAKEVCARHLTPGEFEIILVDDGNTPEATKTISDAAGIRYVRAGGLGVSSARNLGVRAASGEFVAFLDDDDIWLPDHLVEHLRLLRSDSKIGLVFSQGRLADAQLRPVTEPSPMGLPASDASKLILSVCPSFNTVVLRRDIFLGLGGFDTLLDSSEDWDLALRFGSHAKVVGLAVVSSLYRQHGTPTAERLTSRRSQGFRVLRKHWKTSDRHFAALRAEAAIFPLRGWYSYLFVRSASQWLASHRRGEAARCLAGSVRSSPLHAAASKDFWGIAARTARALAQPRRGEFGASE